MITSPVSGLAPELFWLVATTLLTALLWVPYVVNRIDEHGLWPTLRNPGPETLAKAEWAKRMLSAHANAVENLVIFAPLVAAVVLADRTSALTAIAASTYFFARVAHFVIYTAGIPVLRTIAFAVGWGACVALALATLGVV